MVCKLIFTFQDTPFFETGFPLVTKDVQYSRIVSKRALSSLFALAGGEEKKAVSSAP